MFNTHFIPELVLLTLLGDPGKLALPFTASESFLPTSAPKA
jgi:hypothetical protein